MAGCGHGLHGGPANLDRAAVGYWGVLKPDVVLCADEIRGTVRAGEDESTGEVVVVQVRFGNMGDADAGFRRGGFYPVRVPLRIDDQRHLAVVDHVAAVPERPRFDGNNVHRFIVLAQPDVGAVSRSAGIWPPRRQGAAPPGALGSWRGGSAVGNQLRR